MLGTKSKTRVSVMIACFIACVLAVSCSNTNAPQGRTFKDALGYQWSESFYYQGRGSIVNIIGASPDAVWALTDYGEIYGLKEDGWDIQYELGRDSIQEYYSFVLDSNNVWAGASDTMDLEICSFNGSSWETQYESDGTSLHSLMLTGMDGWDSQNVWASATSTGSEYGIIYFFDGKSWSEQFSNEEYSFYDIEVVDENNVWAIGRYKDRPCIFCFDGTKWQEQYEPSANPASIAATGKDHVWVTDSHGGVLFFDGTSWKVQGDLGSSASLYPLDDNHVWAVADSITTKYPPDKQAIMFYDGNNWNEQVSVDGMVEDLFPLDANHAWATISNVDNRTSLLFYDGVEWIEQYETTGMFASIYASSEADIFVENMNRIYQVTKQ